MQHKRSHVSSINSGWFSEPDPGHLVQFYNSDDKLVGLLYKFIHSGLSKGDSCIVVATPAHVASLSERLTNSGIDVSGAQLSGQLFILDAVNTLDSFMVNGLPDKGLFMNEVGKIAKQCAERGKPIRAFGEMVALLWRDGNEEAVMQLEEIWNELSKVYSFSLFCAYPEMHFLLDKQVKDKILHYHTVQYPGFLGA